MTLLIHLVYSWISPRHLIPLIMKFFCPNWPTMVSEVLPWSGSGATLLNVINLFLLTVVSPLLQKLPTVSHKDQSSHPYYFPFILMILTNLPIYYPLSFSDDSNLFYSHSNLNVLFDTVNSELNNISSWIKANKLSLNINKTSFMLFSKKVIHPPQPIYIDNNQILRTDCTKFLGMYIDQDLSWKHHVNYLCKLISRNVGVINKLKHFFPEEILVTLYNTLILPYINYGILAWGNSGIVQINRLLILQKKAFRIINQTDYLAHCDPLFYKHNSLKIGDIYLLQLGIFMFRLNSDSLPRSICSLFTKNEDVHSHFTRHCKEFHQLFARTTLSYRTFKHEGPRLWYSLDSILKNTPILLILSNVNLRIFCWLNTCKWFTGLSMTCPVCLYLIYYTLNCSLIFFLFRGVLTRQALLLRGLLPHAFNFSSFFYHSLCT